MSLKYVYLLLAVPCLLFSFNPDVFAGGGTPVRTKSNSQLSPNEIAIENQARQEAVPLASESNSTGRYYEIDAPKPVVTDRISDTEYSKIQKIVNVDKLTEDPAKVEQQKLTKKQLEQLKLAHFKAEQEKKRQELADRLELARKKQVKISFTEAKQLARQQRVVTPIRKAPVVAKTAPKKKAPAYMVGPGRRSPASTVARYDNKIGAAESRQAARAEKGLQQEIDPNW